MKNYTNVEVIALSESEFDQVVKGNKFEIETVSKDSDKPILFIATINDLFLSSNARPFGFKILIEGEMIEKDVNILNIKSMKYIC